MKTNDVDTNIKKLIALNSCNNCKLVEADLVDANLSGAILREANLRKAVLCNTTTPWGIDNTGCK